AHMGSVDVVLVVEVMLGDLGVAVEVPLQEVELATLVLIGGYLRLDAITRLPAVDTRPGEDPARLGHLGGVAVPLVLQADRAAQRTADRLEEIGPTSVVWCDVQRAVLSAGHEVRLAGASDVEQPGFLAPHAVGVVKAGVDDEEARHEAQRSDGD